MYGWKLEDKFSFGMVYFQRQCQFQAVQANLSFPSTEKFAAFFLRYPTRIQLGRQMCMYDQKIPKTLLDWPCFFWGGGDIMLAFEGLGGQSLV